MSQVSGPSQTPSTSSARSPRGKRLSDQERFWIVHFLGMAQIVLGVGLDVVNVKVHRKMKELMDDNFEYHRISMANIPKVQNVKMLWEAAKTSGSARGKRLGGRSKLPCREEVKFLMETAPASTRKLAVQLERSNIPGKRSTIRNIVRKELGIKPYKTPYGQKLKILDIERRLQWAIFMHEHLMVKKDIDLYNILWSDECKVGPSGCGNRQNDRIYRHPLDWDPYEHLVEKAHYDKSVMIWVGIHPIAGVIGPYITEDIEQLPGEKQTLNSARYVRLLEDKIIPELKRRLTPEQFASCYFQQDGATVHTAKESLACLRKHFGNRIISLKTALIWPPNSPDMSPLDYWFWAQMKMLLNQYDEAVNMEEFKLRILQVCRLITPEQCSLAVKDFIYRLQALIHAEGRHFEPTFKKFKVEILKMTDVCELCDEVHLCPCAGCDDMCLEDAFADEFNVGLDLDREPMDFSDGEDEGSDWSAMEEELERL